MNSACGTARSARTSGQCTKLCGVVASSDIRCRFVTDKHEEYQLILNAIEDVMSEKPDFLEWHMDDSVRYHLPDLIAFREEWNARAGDVHAQMQLVSEMDASNDERKEVCRLILFRNKLLSLA